MDAYSRYLLACVAMSRPNAQHVRRALELVFEEFGLPAAIRSDNGTPFASNGVAGLSQLSVWWFKLGIRHERIEPGKPQQNGRHELEYPDDFETVTISRLGYLSWNGRSVFVSTALRHECIGLEWQPGGNWNRDALTMPWKVPNPVKRDTEHLG